MEGEISPKQQRLFNLALEFNKVCEENNIKYSLSCGTALGAVREGGFIPWDDDFDIMITLPEYKKFTEIYKKGNYPFLWMCRETEKDSPVVFARIYEKGTDLDALENFPYIDIHIYAGCEGLNKKTEKEIKKSDRLVKIYWFKKRKYHNIFRRKKSFLGTLIKWGLVFLSAEKIADKITEGAERYELSRSGYLMPVQGYYGMREVLPCGYFNEYTYFDFNGLKLPLICEYDNYLKKLYGDYMTPVKFERF